MTTCSRRDFLKQTAVAAAAAGTASLIPGAVGSALAADQVPTDGGKPFPMKFSICNETFLDWPQEKAFAFAAKCGYQGIEIAPFTINTDVTKIDGKTRTKLRKLAQRNDLEVVGLHWLLAKTEGLYLTSPDKDVRKATAVYLGELARFCADLGGKVMIFGSPQQRNLLPGVSPEEGTKYAVEVFQAAVPTLEKTGVTIGLEPLGPDMTDIIVFCRRRRRNGGHDRLAAGQDDARLQGVREGVSLDSRADPQIPRPAWSTSMPTTRTSAGRAWASWTSGRSSRRFAK